MATGIVSWSKTAATNDTADSAVNWQEGQAPSSVNDSGRGMMAATAKYRDDVNGSLTTGGTSTAYTVSSNQGFASLAALDGQTITITMDQTSGVAPTLAVDGLAAKPINISTGVAPASGALLAGSPVRLTYYNSVGEFIIHNQMGTLGSFTGTDAALSGTLSLTSTGYMKLPSGSTAQRPGSPAAAQLRFNSDLTVPEFYDGSSWNVLSPTLPIPQGRLTLASNTPYMTGDAVSATTIYYTFAEGAWVVIHNGARLIPYQMVSQFSLALTSSQAANNIYDIFLAYNSGVPVIGTGPSWADGTAGSVSAGSGARGTGTGGAALTRLNGVHVNAASMSLIWNTGSGNTTITVPANQAVYLGSILIDGSAGQVTCHTSYGQSRKWGLWNAYNRRPIMLKAGDATSSWSYGSSTLRPANNSTANSISAFTGLAEDGLDLSAYTNADTGNVGQGAIFGFRNGIGLNSTSASSGFSSDGFIVAASTTARLAQVAMSSHSTPPLLGVQTVTLLEANKSSGTPTWAGGEGNNLLRAKYMA